MLEIHDLRFQYHAAEQPTFERLNLTIESGVFLAIVGPSGSGKSTLLRTFNGLIPHFHGGRFGGDIVIDGINTRQVSTANLSRVAGFVGQEPEAQTVFDIVADEVAFGPENLGLDSEEIKHRLQNALQTLDIAQLHDRDISTLSGGERQRVVIAATLAMGSRLLVLDEPLSQLDPWAVNDLLETLARVNREQGITVVIAEHRVDRVLPYCTHVRELPARHQDATPQPIAQALTDLAIRPTLVRLAQQMGWRSLPLTVDEACSIYARSEQVVDRPVRDRPASRQILLRAEGITIELEGQARVNNVSLALETGSVVALMGANGSGKTTLLRALAGFQRLTSGSIEIAGKPLASLSDAERGAQIGYVPQHPDALFLGLSVRDELELAYRAENADGSVESALEFFGLTHLAHHNSFDISGGERQRLALAIATARSPSLLLLDEPTRGMDQRAIEKLEQLLTELATAGVCIVLATHDSDLVAACAGQVFLLQSGKLVSSGTPSDVFAHEPVLLTDIGRVLGSDILTLHDVGRSLAQRSERAAPPEVPVPATTPK